MFFSISIPKQESSGLPNKIQITREVVSKLASKGYEIVPRGHVHVKVCWISIA